MTVILETPEEERTGSAVREVHVQRPFMEMPHVTSSKEVKGEAVVVDLGDRGVLFALLGDDYAYQVIFDAFPVPSGSGETSVEGIIL